MVATVYSETTMPRKTRRTAARKVEFADLPAVTPAKDSTVGTVIGERSDVYSLVPGDPCALTVPSATREGVVYVVKYHPETGAISCSCKGYENAKAGKTCRHCATVAEDIPGMFPHFWPDVMKQDAPPATATAPTPEAVGSVAECRYMCSFGDIPCARCGWMMPTTKATEAARRADFD